MRTLILRQKYFYFCIPHLKTPQPFFRIGDQPRQMTKFKFSIFFLPLHNSESDFMHNLTWPHNRANIICIHIWIHIIFQFEEKFAKFWSIYSAIFDPGAFGEFEVTIPHSVKPNFAVWSMIDWCLADWAVYPVNS